MSTEVMQGLAAPMIGGMITEPLVSLFVFAAIYKLIGWRRLAAAVPAGARWRGPCAGTMRRLR